MNCYPNTLDLNLISCQHIGMNTFARLHFFMNPIYLPLEHTELIGLMNENFIFSNLTCELVASRTIFEFTFSLPARTCVFDWQIDGNLCLPVFENSLFLGVWTYGFTNLFVNFLLHGFENLCLLLTFVTGLDWRRTNLDWRRLTVELMNWPCFALGE